MDGEWLYIDGRNVTRQEEREDTVELPLRDLIGQLVSEGFDRDDGVLE
jgi:hypothetical protein